MSQDFTFFNVTKCVGDVGLSNLGNTCFINAALQCLYTCPELKLFFGSGSYVHFINTRNETRGEYSKALGAALRRMSESKHSVCCKELVAVSLKYWNGYVRYSMEDSHDFFCHLFWTLQAELEENEELSKNALEQELSFSQVICNAWIRRSKSAVYKLFTVQLVSKCSCACGHISQHVDESPSVSLDIPVQSSTLKICLENYFDEELINDAKCPKCKKQGTYKKQISLGRLPPYFVIHLKRFSRVNNNNVKNSNFVSFEMDMNLDKYVVNGLQTNKMYELIGVIVHLSNSESYNNGHYIAYCKRNNRWLEFNDPKVSSTTSRKLLSSRAYVLFYKAKTFLDGGLPFDECVLDSKYLKNTVTSNHNRKIKLHKPSNHTSTTACQHASSASSVKPHETLLTSSVTSTDPALDDYVTNTASPAAAVFLTANVATADKDTQSVFQNPSTVDSCASPAHAHGTPRNSTNTSLTLSPTKSQLIEQSSFQIGGHGIPEHEKSTVATNVHISGGNEAGDGGSNIRPAKLFPDADVREKGACHHPDFNLDVDDPLLSEFDLPPAVFRNTDDVETWTVVSLQLWLKFRRIKQSGIKTELIMRVKDCVRMGKHRRIYPGVDGGKWHTLKKKKIAQNVNDGDPFPLLPVGANVWKSFPSVHLPEALTMDMLSDYFKALPPVTFSHSQGVLASLQPDSRDVDSDSDSDLEYYTGELKVQKSDFHALCQRAVLKCISRGERYLQSGHVLSDSAFDTIKGNHYFIKAQVKASMEKDIHCVTVTISNVTGEICIASCDCKASSLRRCGHIAAVILMVLEHIEVTGHEAVTCTGRPCYWLKRPPGRNPGFLQDKPDYKNRSYFVRRVNFNPFPSKYQSDGDFTAEEVESFRKLVEAEEPNCLWMYHLAKEPPQLGIDSVDEPCEEIDNEPNDIYSELEAVAIKCSKQLWLLNQVRKLHSAPFELEGTCGQKDNPNWLHIRSMYATASVSQTLTGLHKESAKIAFLRKHVWMLDNKPNTAMRTGTDNEGKARNDYTELMVNCYPDTEVFEAGTWVNPKYPMMACSPDGRVWIPTLMMWILLEIKVLTIIGVIPSLFDQFLTKKQMSGFYLKRHDTGEIIMNKSHRYYRQIQHSLCVLEYDLAHLFVWSTAGTLIVEVPRDENYFYDKRELLIQRHRELLLPEHFLKRTKRHLPPIELKYLPFHENENDDYFITHD